jgi:hypothetical protein
MSHRSAMKNMEPIAQILSRYVQALELTPEERYELNIWMGKSKARMLFFDELSDRELWLESNSVEPENIAENSLIQIRKKLEKMA